MSLKGIQAFSNNITKDLLTLLTDALRKAGIYGSNQVLPFSRCHELFWFVRGLNWLKFKVALRKCIWLWNFRFRAWLLGRHAAIFSLLFWLLFLSAFSFLSLLLSPFIFWLGNVLRELNLLFWRRSYNWLLLSRLSQYWGCLTLRCCRLKFKNLLLSNLVLFDGLALFDDISKRRTNSRIAVTVAAVVVVVVGLLPSLF